MFKQYATHNIRLMIFIGLKGATIYQTDLKDVLELLYLLHAFLCWPSGAMPCQPVSEQRLTGLVLG